MNAIATTSEIRNSIAVLWFNGAHVAAAEAAIIAASEEPGFVAMMVDNAVGHLMGPQFDCVRELADEVMRALQMNAANAEAFAEAEASQAQQKAC